MTDRTLNSASDLDTLDFAKGDGLVALIAQDARNGAVLMTAFATREALVASLDSGQMHFWSRSRGELWRKGETSGNTLTVRSLHADCDGDAVLALVEPAGPACHTGEPTCFGEGAPPRGVGTMGTLAATVASRAAERPEGSYTTKLLDDSNLRLKKLGEETAELITALASGDPAQAAEEAADLVYHLLVALQADGVTWAEVSTVLEGRAA